MCAIYTRSCDHVKDCIRPNSREPRRDRSYFSTGFITSIDLCWSEAYSIFTNQTIRPDSIIWHTWKLGPRPSSQQHEIATIHWNYALPMPLAGCSDISSGRKVNSPSTTISSKLNAAPKPATVEAGKQSVDGHLDYDANYSKRYFRGDAADLLNFDEWRDL